jgi:hypothetical protein
LYGGHPADTKRPGTTIAAPLSILCDGYWEYPSVWYSFNGTGNIMAVSTCSPLTDNVAEVAVFQTGCGTVSTCVTNEDLGLEVKCQTTNSYMYTFDSVKGQTYYAKIGGTDIVKFNVSVDDYPGPPNDSCESAEPLTLSIEKPVNVSGSTKHALVSTVCDSNKGRFVWYSFLGTGDTVTLSTCSSDNNANDLSVQTSCDASKCVTDFYADRNQGCVGEQTGKTGEFLSTKGQTYIVKVGSSSTWFMGGVTTGSFVLTMTAAALDGSDSDNDEFSSTNGPTRYDQTSGPSDYDPTLPPLPGYCEESFFDCFISKISPGELASCSDCILTKMVVDPVASSGSDSCEAATARFCSDLKQCSSCSSCQSELEEYMSCQMNAMTTDMGGTTCTFSSCSTASSRAASALFVSFAIPMLFGIPILLLMLLM